MYIEDISFMDNIFKIEKNVSSNHNKPVTNLSYWNPSVDYSEMMLRVLSPQSLNNIFKYV